MAAKTKLLAEFGRWLIRSYPIVPDIIDDNQEKFRNELWTRTRMRHYTVNEVSLEKSSEPPPFWIARMLEMRRKARLGGLSASTDASLESPLVDNDDDLSA